MTRGGASAGSWTRRTIGAVVGLLLVALALPVVPADRAGAGGTTFVVNSSVDRVNASGRADARPGDGLCVIDPALRGGGLGAVCTLRAAMDEADALAGRDRIEFAIPGGGVHRIEPVDALPTVTDGSGVVIDGYTQPGSRVNTADHGSNAVIKVELRGAGPARFDGLYFNRSSDNVVRGLALFDFKRTIRFWGDEAERNEVVGNFIGTDASGTFGQEQWVVNSTGVQIENGASSNRIGKPGNEHRNVISGNGDRGVGLFEDGADDNVVQNNVIGLRPDGSAPLGNWSHGVDVNWDASDNLIGGGAPGERNVISANRRAGVEISHNRTPAGVERNRVIGNLIGTDLTGSSAPRSYRNGQFGVHLEGRPNCFGTTCPLDIARNEVVGNVIVGGPAGVILSKGVNRNVIADNLIGVLPDGTAIDGSAQWGVLVSAGAIFNVVQGNTVRGAQTGIQVVPNDLYGTCTGSNCAIDARIPTYGNTLSRNSIAGIQSGLGIDLWPTGSATSTPPSFVQGGVGMPSIVSAADGVVVAQSCPGCLVEVFRADPLQVSPFGQGIEYVGAAAAGADGRAAIGAPGIAVGALVTATTTGSDGSTSEFARSVAMAVARPPVVPAPPGATTPQVSSSPPVPSAPAASTGLAPARRCSLGQC